MRNKYRGCKCVDKGILSMGVVDSHSGKVQVVSKITQQRALNLKIDLILRGLDDRINKVIH